MFHNHKAQNDRMDKYRSLLEDYNSEQDIPQDLDFLKLSKGQQHALDLFSKGQNILVIGAGGTGKSALIREIKYQAQKNFPNKKIAVCGTTGISSYTIGGITINSFMGIGTGEQDLDTLVKRIRRKNGIRDRIQQIDILIIDEISMASAELFEKINAICQYIRKSTSPFGGIQVVLTGDFLQLLPVFNKVQLNCSNSNSKKSKTEEEDTRLIFESPVFRKYFTPKNIINLTENFRQDNQDFIQLLMRIRYGKHTTSDIDTLRSRLISNLTSTPSDLDSFVHLVSSNKQAQIINLTNMTNIDSAPFEYKSTFIEQGNPDISGELTRELQSQFSQKGIVNITLKQGARVMLIKNLSVEDGLVNGSVGTITHFECINNIYYPVVQFDNGIKQLVLPTEWELEFDNSSSKGVQLPLMLCWALTIHKCQSLTLDKAVMDLSHCFCDAQIYVALSRVKSLSGVFLHSFNERKITVNQKVKQYLSSFIVDE